MSSHQKQPEQTPPSTSPLPLLLGVIALPIVLMGVIALIKWLFGM